MVGHVAVDVLLRRAGVLAGIVNGGFAGFDTHYLFGVRFQSPSKSSTATIGIHKQGLASAEGLVDQFDQGPCHSFVDLLKKRARPTGGAQRIGTVWHLGSTQLMQGTIYLGLREQALL